MRHGLGGLGLKVLAVKVRAVSILTPVQRETRGIQTRTQPYRQIIRPLIFLQELPHGQRSSRFVAVDAGGEVEAGKVGCVPCSVFRVARGGAGESKEARFGGSKKFFDGPAVRPRRSHAIA